MNTHDDDIHDVKPPDGLLAERELAKEKAEAPTAVKPEDTPSPAMLPVDPNYQEPTPAAAYTDMADKVCCAMHEAISVSSMDGVVALATQRETLLRFAIDRIKLLESALMPFAQGAMTMANSHMCLAALSRPDEPAGGMWISNPPDGIQLMPNQGLFFAACDALGRQRVHDHMATCLDMMHDMTKLANERDHHVADGGTVH